MADLIVKPSYQFSERDIITADKLNLAATPVVELALEDPVNDQNFFRNGNFYSSFWTTPAGVNCPINVWTTNASYWLCKPLGAAVTFLRSSTVPDIYSLFSAQIKGNTGTTDVEFGQQINADLSATMRRNITFSGYIYNFTGLTVSPKLKIYTANAFNNFAAITLQTTLNLQTCPDSSWTYVTATVDITTKANVANGMLIAVLIPAALTATTKYVLFSRLKVQIGEVATEFVDDTSLFVQAPSVDSTMLQDGCIARPSLFQPNVIPTGAYQAKSINNGDINDGAINGRTLASGAAVANLGYTPVNKAGDSAIGKLSWTIDTAVGSGAAGAAAILINSTTTNQSNDGYFPAIAFNRPNTYARALGLSTTGRFKTVDSAGTIGYLLDTITKVDTNSYQDGSITLAKLAQSLINIIVPPGIIHPFAGPNIPSGWLVCDGTPYYTSQYPALYAAIGGYYGSGGSGASAYFVVPDLRGRQPLGYVNTAIGGVTARAFASYGGEENHQLSIAEMPGHDHGYSQSPHDHALHQHDYINPTGTTIGVTGGGAQIAYPSGFTKTGAAAVPAANANINFVGQGGWQPHNTMQPFCVMYYIIKV